MYKQPNNLTEFERGGELDNNKNGSDDNDDGDDDLIEDFDMFDITTGKIIQCDHNQPLRYEPSVRWDDNDTTNSNDSNESSKSPIYQSPPLSPNYQQPQILPVQIIQQQSISTPPPADHVVIQQQPQQQQLVECKDMEPSSKINQLQPYVVEMFEIACHRFYRAIIDSDFWSQVSKEMNFYDMKEGEWVTSPLGCHQERELFFKTPISFKIGPKVASVRQIQRIRRTATGGYFMENSSISSDIPYGDNFTVENYISLEPTGKNSCLLKVSTAVKFIKSIWGLTGLIERSVIQSNKDFFEVYIKLAKKLVSEKQILHSVILDNNHNQQNNNNNVNNNQQTINNQQQINNNHNQQQNTNQQQQQQQQQCKQINHNHKNPLPPIPNQNEKITLPTSYEEMKNLFIQLFKESLQPRAIKIISQRTGQQVTNITVHQHYSVGHVAQFLIPQAIPELTTNQHYELFWADKRNDAGLFFIKDMDLPLFNYLQSSDIIYITTINESQASVKSLCFQIVQPGKKANIKSSSVINMK